MGVKRSNKFFTILVAAVLVLGMIPAVAFAANTDVGNWAALNTALNAAQDGDTITLTGNISSVAALNYSGGKNVTIDLNGHTLGITASNAVVVSGSGSKLSITNGGRLNIIASSGNGIAATNGGELEVTSTTLNLTTMGGGVGVFADGADSSVTVGNGCNIAGGASAANGGSITAYDVAGGASVATGGTITVNHLVDTITVEGTVVPAANYENPPSWETYKAGYYTYTDGVSVVWVVGNGPVPDPEVLSVTVSPNPIDVEVGKTQQFTAVVDGHGNSQDVTWSVTGNTSPDTTIDATTGLLTVASDETATTLTVTATPAENTDMSGSATVNVTAPKEKEKKEKKEEGSTETTETTETTGTVVPRKPILSLPKTGDAGISNLSLSLVITALAALGSALVTVYRKRSRA
ncbi:MAG: LPXTG cell wall anchor domain-containing protein [Coriobacteriia bacterium]|nr:LPXTG cell wall anchor domain-containing protein [Coriobacteriia bacterium]